MFSPHQADRRRPARALEAFDKVNPDLMWDNLVRYGAESLEEFASEDENTK